MPSKIKTRRILALDVAPIAAKGHLAALSRKKYGPRPCGRTAALTKVMGELKVFGENLTQIKSDESPHYPGLISKHLPGVKHIRFKGQRGCIVGQGELKKTGHPPLFFLNHTYAMFRDNLKRLTRRTWCTTKKIKPLKNLLYIYSLVHNLVMDHGQRILRQSWLAETI